MSETTLTRRERRAIAKAEASAPSAPSAPAPTTPAPSPVGELSPFELPGSKLRVKARAARRGWYAPRALGAPASTRQAQILNLALIGAPTSTQGIVRGRDLLSQTPFTHDPITAYNMTPRLVTSTNSVRIGDVGSGKSSESKTSMMRELVPRDRRGVVFDKKAKGSEGEYAEVARYWGDEPLRITDDGSGVTLNLLDPTITRVQLDAPTIGPDGHMIGNTYGTRDPRYALMQNTLELLNEGILLTAWEKKALREALRLVDGAVRGHAATPAELLPWFGNVDAVPGLRDHAADMLHEAGLGLRFRLEELLQEYPGVFDGETSKEVNLAAKLTSWDISQLPSEGPAIPIVMNMGYSWLLGTLREHRGVKTKCLWEEGWFAINGPISRFVRSSQKLSRALGIANEFNIHKGKSDVRPDSNGAAVLEESQTVYIFRTIREDDAQWCVDTFSLAPETKQTIMELPTGHFIAKIATNPEVEVHHIRSSDEVWLTDTDEALRELA